MSFRLKTILGIALIEIILLAILIASSLYYLRTSNEQELLRRTEITAKLLATMTSDAVISSDLATLDSLVQQALKNNGLVFVRIRNAGGLVLSEDGNPADLQAAFKPITQVSEISGQRIDFAAPIKVGDEYFGQVEIGLSSQLLDHLVSSGTKRLLSIAAMEIILVAVFGFFLGSILTSQLGELNNSAKRVAAGEFGYQIDVTGNDEVADTARSFNTMSRALLDHANDLKAARDRAEAGRIHAENLLYDAMNSVSQSIFVIDDNHNIEFINKTARNMYAINWTNIEEGTNVDNLIDELSAITDSERSLADVREERLVRLRNQDMHQSWQSRLKDGSTILHTQRPMSDGGVVLVDTDITELYATLEKNKKLELELIHAHKLESLGTLASGVAHEINTPAQFINDNLRFMRESFDPLRELLTKIEAGAKLDIEKELEDVDWEFVKDEVPAALNEAICGIESIGKIVRSIKEFSHPDDDELQVYDMEKLLETAVTVTRPQWRHSAKLSVNCETDDTNVECYPGEISQVLINLIVNAADAISENNAKQGIENALGEINLVLRHENESLAIDVIDNGGGMPEDIQRSIFDMFFTTKPPGQGTGQGLAISKSIVEAKHGGELKVQSSLGKGTHFTILFPAAISAKSDRQFEEDTKLAS